MVPTVGLAVITTSRWRWLHEYRYSSRPPGYSSTPPSSTFQIRVASVRINDRLWLTNTSVPSKVVSERARLSADSRSRWLVGSSIRIRLPGLTSSRASATRERSPPDSTLTGLSTSSPENMNAPRIDRTRATGAAGLARCTTSCTVAVMSSVSPWCWA